MKDFKGQSRLRKLSVHSRMVYSSFLIFTLVGLGLTFWLTSDMVGVELERFGEYYSGEAAAPSPAPAEAADDGPVFELPPDLAEAPAAEPMATRKLLEVTHFHIFSMPVYMLILAHIFVVSSASARSKSVWIGIGVGSTAVHIAAPWLAAAGSAGAQVAYAVSGTGLAAAMVWMSVVPLWEMWGPVRGAGARTVRAETVASS